MRSTRSSSHQRRWRDKGRLFNRRTRRRDAILGAVLKLGLRDPRESPVCVQGVGLLPIGSEDLHSS